MERRREKRVPGSGIVEIAISNPAPLTIQAALVETSASGFRAAHDCQALEPGLAVSFIREGLSGRATSCGLTSSTAAAPAVSWCCSDSAGSNFSSLHPPFLSPSAGIYFGQAQIGLGRICHGLIV
jgi:hypothetical protein